MGESGYVADHPVHRLPLFSQPFAGDQGDGERVLSDRFACVRKAFSCHACAELVPAGKWARVRRGAGEDGFATYRWCESCLRCQGLTDARKTREALGDLQRGGAPTEAVEAARRLADQVYEVSWSAWIAGNGRGAS